MTIDPKSISLMDLESHIEALLDTQDLVTPDQESAFKQDLQTSLAQLPAKRESVAQMTLFLMEQAEVAKGKKELYTQREKRLRKQAEKLSGYVLEVIKGKGKDPKTDRYKKLNGTTVTLAPYKCPVSAVIEDMGKIPMKFKTAVVKMKAEDWAMLAWDSCSACKGTGKNIVTLEECTACSGSGRTSSFLYPFISNVKFPDDEVKLTPIKEALEKGEEVPGAKLDKDKLRLEIV